MVCDQGSNLVKLFKKITNNDISDQNSNESDSLLENDDEAEETTIFEEEIEDVEDYETEITNIENVNEEINSILQTNNEIQYSYPITVNNKASPIIATDILMFNEEMEKKLYINNSLPEYINHLEIEMGTISF